jgi:pimeloyl-ACP methyl ester carboxylesterase
VPLMRELDPAPQREALLAALNGVLGDYLVETGNPLAIPMQLRRDGKPLALTREGLQAVESPSAKLVVLAHGLCLGDLQWLRDGHDHGAALERDLGCARVYLRYNTGRHISTNGRDFAALLEELTTSWPRPLEDLTIVGHSMGGLVARSAFHYGTLAQHEWPRRLRRLVFLGTPHHGAPWERGGQWLHLLLGVSGYTEPFARLGRIRSAGITDLRYGSMLDEDWQGRDRFARGRDTPRPLPLPPGVECYAIAATTSPPSGVLAQHLLGDGLVPLTSGLGQHDDPRRALPFQPDHTWIATETGHLALLGRPEVYERLRAWLSE